MDGGAVRDCVGGRSRTVGDVGGGQRFALGCEGTDDGFVAPFEGAYTFSKFLIFPFALFFCAPTREFPFVLDVGIGGGWAGSWEACAQTTVFLLEFSDSAFEVGVVGFATVAGVLCGDAVAVGAGLLALLWGQGGAGAFSGRFAGRHGRDGEGQGRGVDKVGRHWRVQIGRAHV